MTDALRAEVLKLFTTRLWLWLSLLVVGLSGLVAVLVTANANAAIEEVGGALPNVLSGATSFGYLVSAVLGVVGLTGEFRHLTATPTFLAVPRRGRVVSAKLLTHLVFGLVLGVVALGVAYGIAAPWLDSKGVTADGDVVTRALVGGVVTVAVFGVIGVGVGALLRNQVAAVVALVLYLFVLEPIVGVVPGVRSAYPYLPGGAVAALTQTQEQQFPGVVLLEPWQGGVLLLAYGAVFAVLGTWLAVQRDIT